VLQGLSDVAATSIVIDDRSSLLKIWHEQYTTLKKQNEAQTQVAHPSQQ